MINSNGPERAQCTDNGQPGHQLIDGDFAKVQGLYNGTCAEDATTTSTHYTNTGTCGYVLV